MGFFLSNWLKSNFGKQRQREEDFTPYSWPWGTDGRPQYTITTWDDYIKYGFNANALIYRCIMVKAGTAAMAPLRIYTGDEDNPKRLPPNHLLSRLMKRPNPWHSGMEFQELALCHLNVAGNCYIFLSPGGRKEGQYPESMWLLRPDRVRSVPQRGTLLGYVYVPEGASMEDAEAILPQDIIHIKLPNPGDRFEGLGAGLSPLSACAKVGDVDNYVTDFISSFFKHAAVPYGLLKTKTRLDSSEVQRIKELWRKQHAGYEKWHDVGVLDADTEYQRAGLTFEEFGFSILDERDEARICMAFGVPPIVAGTRIGMERSTYSNYEQAWKSFLEVTMQTEYARFSDQFNLVLGSDELWFQYDLSAFPAFRESEQAKWDRASDGVARSFITVNDARGIVGLDPVPGRDVFLVPFNVIEVAAGGTKPAAEPPPKEEEEPPEEEEAEEKARRLDGVRAERVMREMDRVARVWEPRFREAARVRFEQERRDVLAILGEKAREARERKQVVEWQAYLLAISAYLEMAGGEWRSAFLPLFRGLVADEGETLGLEFGISFDVVNPYVEQFLQNYTIRFADEIRDTSEGQIRAIIEQAQAEGWSVPQMQTAIEGLFEQWLSGEIDEELRDFIEARMTPLRTEMIARTETIRSRSYGAQALYQAAGVRAKEWHAVQDARTCDWCLELNGKIVAIDEDYFTRGSEFVISKEVEGEVTELVMRLDYENVGAPPLHVMCRCCLLPVIL